MMAGSLDAQEASFRHQVVTEEAAVEGNGVGDQVIREVVSIPQTPKGGGTPNGARSPYHSNQVSNAQSHAITPAGTRSPSALASPSMSRSPLLKTPKTPRTPRTPRTPWTPSLSPMGTPMRRVMINMKAYLEDVGHLTRLNPQDAWLPITESRNGNAYYSAFHNLNAGIGFQALVLPVSFTVLGWTWGIISLSAAYIWQLYTLWLLIRLHESIPGKRYNRYVELAKAAFGEKLGGWLSTFPILYLSAGTATALIIVGGGAMKLFFQIVCGPTCASNPLTTVEWYLVFTCLSLVLAQLPNLNSIAWLSLIGAVTAIAYCTLLWILSVSRPRPTGVSYEPVRAKSDVASTFAILNALGAITFAFRGHNIALEIQATMPSSLKHPAHVPMWRGAKVAYLLVAFCLFPLAIGGYWAYGNLIPQGGILNALYGFHNQDIARGLLGLTFLLVVINCLSSFQIYSMPMFDNFEASYISWANRPCPWWVRSGFRVFFVFFAFFVGVALPFLNSLAGLFGGLSLPVTFAYPCLMWVLIKKPEKYSSSWYLNWGLGIVGSILSVAFVVGGVWSIIDTGLKLKFFQPS
uniref:Amino acid transporter transmembrane domain-containing protein n=1 Tax=Araucaria cunninghamii TaxID=56994 RepID=A0A0D6R3I3_ARACU